MLSGRGWAGAGLKIVSWPWVVERCRAWRTYIIESKFELGWALRFACVQGDAGWVMEDGE